jgi:3-hydroxyisobutyrate dehydrogenase-like beta-hydroxyacid dehydrogenase
VTRAGIIGYGEIGSAIASLYRKRGLDEPAIHDPALGYAKDISACDVVHVCVPSSAVPQVIRERMSALWIVHSTVAVGTCRPLAEKVGGRLVHAPVRGIHPDLAKGMETFVMPVGGQLSVDGKTGLAQADATKALRDIGIPARSWGAWEETELAKLLCTLRYGVDIEFMRHAHELCGKFGVDFDRVYTQWTRHYSDGYELLGQWWFHRPVLKPMPGPIGGHCVLPNARLLAPHSDVAKAVLEVGSENWQPMKAAPSPKSEGGKRMA